MMEDSLTLKSFAVMARDMSIKIAYLIIAVDDLDKAHALIGDVVGCLPSRMGNISQLREFRLRRENIILLKSLIDLMVVLRKNLRTQLGVIDSALIELNESSSRQIFKCTAFAEASALMDQNVAILYNLEKSVTSKLEFFNSYYLKLLKPL